MPDFNNNGSIGPKDIRIAHLLRRAARAEGLSAEEVLALHEEGKLGETLKNTMKEHRETMKEHREDRIETFLANNDTPKYNEIAAAIAGLSKEDAQALIRSNPDFLAFAQQYPGAVLYAWNQGQSSKTETTT